MHKKNIKDWSVESVRFTTFLIEEPIRINDWYNSIIGNKPYEINIKSDRQRIELGNFNNNRFVISINNKRVDVFWEITDIGRDEKGNVKVLGDIDKVFDIFLNNVIVNFIDKCCSIDSNRLALGCRLIKPVNNKEEGYKIIAGYLKNYVKIDIYDSSDFFYRVNRPRNVVINRKVLEINRIMTWMVRKIEPLIINDQELGELRYDAFLEMDINTAPNSLKRANKIMQKKIVNILIKNAKEIAEKGDIK